MKAIETHGDEDGEAGVHRALLRQESASVGQNGTFFMLIRPSPARFCARECCARRKSIKCYVLSQLSEKAHPIMVRAIIISIAGLAGRNFVG
jgi:hypothetical protein